MTNQDRKLAKTITLSQAIALGITIVVGSGLLVLPGIAYKQVGSAAIYSWLIDALLVIPLLVIFAHLGSNFPGAGGITGFVQAAFTRRAGSATEILALGTFSLGIPSIAITGGHYLAYVVGGGVVTTTIGTLLLLGIAGSINLLGAKVSGNVQQFLAYSLVILIACVAVVVLVFGSHNNHAGVAPPSNWYLAIPSLGAVFFAYTGWEMLAFTTEEYRNPKRDFPIAVAVSFIIVLLLYLAIALAIQFSLLPKNPQLESAPVAAMLSPILGNISSMVVAIAGVVIIAANLIGAIWAASRLVFSSARERLLPGIFSKVNGQTQSPQAAIIFVLVIFTAVAILNLSGLVSLATLFKLAGQNFFILYGLSVISYIKLSKRWTMRIFGVFTLAIVVLTMGTFGISLIYPALLFVLGFVLTRKSSSKKKPDEGEVEFVPVTTQ